MLLENLRLTDKGRLLTAFLFCAFMLVGQEVDAFLTIAVSDHSGAVVPFVDVLLQHVESGETKTVNRTVEPVRVQLSPGTYEILLAKNQYTLPLVRSRIYLKPGVKASLDIVAYLKSGSMLVVGRQIELPDSAVEYETVQLVGAPVALSLAYRIRAEHGGQVDYGGGSSNAPDGGLATMTYDRLTVTARQFMVEPKRRRVRAVGNVKVWGADDNILADAAEIDLLNRIVRWPSGRLRRLE